MIVCKKCNKKSEESDAHNHFRKTLKTGKFYSICKECHGIKMSEGRLKKNNNFRIVIDFSKNEKSFENLKILAEEEIRTIEQQALYILINEVERILNQ